MGTKIKKKREIKKINGEILNNLFSLIEDKIKIIIIAKKTNDKCFKKNA